jgi:OOP family OmpA-OmpF porin
LSSVGTKFTGNVSGQNEALLENSDDMKLRFGATAGLGLAYNLSSKWALNLEGRFGVTPSIFGAASDCRKAEATGRLTLGATYTFGGKNFAKVSDRVIEKEVIKEVVKEVPVEVIKEVTKEVYAGATAVFFKIGKAKISPEGMVNIKLMAKAMKNNPNASYKIAGFADKATGTASFNQTLSEKRAQAVYDALVAEGVNPNQLEKVAMGGTDPMFEKAYLNRVVIMEVK